MVGKKGMNLNRAPHYLRDMREVYLHPEHKADERPALRALRDQFADNPDAFFVKLQRLEEKYHDAKKSRAGNGKAGGVASTASASTTPSAPPPSNDEGTERALEQAERLLAQFRQENPGADDQQPVFVASKSPSPPPG